MAYEIPDPIPTTRLAGVDLSASQYRAVNANSSDLAVLPSAGGRIVGVVQNAPTSGRAATIWRTGVSKMVAGATVTAGSNAAVDNVGRVVNAATGNFIIGVIRGGGAVGTLVPVELAPGAAASA